MLDAAITEKLWNWAERYNNPRYFEEDPIAFPRRFYRMMTTVQPSLGFEGGEWRPSLQDIEIAAVFAAHLAWGRRSTIIKDCSRLFDEMLWRPYDYVMAGDWRNDATSLHRTVKWSETAAICRRLKAFYSGEISGTARTENSLRSGDGSAVIPPIAGDGSLPLTLPGVACLPEGNSPSSQGGRRSLEELSASEMRTLIYGQKPDPKAANKKIWMMRRWMVRDDGRVDLGVWKHSSKQDLVIPLDVHVYRQASELGLTKRRSKDFATAMEITDAFREIFPDDPAKGDFALFGYGVTRNA